MEGLAMFALVSEYVNSNGEEIKDSYVFVEERLAREEYESLTEIALVGESIRLFEMKETDSFKM
jgi:hypothetical protein